MSVPVEMARRVSQLRHDVDDVYQLLDSTNQAVTAIAATQRRHSTRLEEIQQSLDVTVGRLDRLDQAQQRLAEQQQSMAEQQQRLAEQQQEQGTKLDAILMLLRGDRDADSS